MVTRSDIINVTLPPIMGMILSSLDSSSMSYLFCVNRRMRQISKNAIAINQACACRRIAPGKELRDSRERLTISGLVRQFALAQVKKVEQYLPKELVKDEELEEDIRSAPLITPDDLIEYRKAFAVSKAMQSFHAAARVGRSIELPGYKKEDAKAVALKDGLLYLIERENLSACDVVHKINNALRNVTFYPFMDDFRGCFLERSFSNNIGSFLGNALNVWVVNKWRSELLLELPKELGDCRVTVHDFVAICNFLKDALIDNPQALLKDRFKGERVALQQAIFQLERACSEEGFNALIDFQKRRIQALIQQTPVNDEERLSMLEDRLEDVTNQVFAWIIDRKRLLEEVSSEPIQWSPNAARFFAKPR